MGTSASTAMLRAT